LLVVSSCSQGNSGQIKSTPPKVKLLTLAKQQIVLPRAYICEIKAEHYVEIRARVQGYLEEIFIDEGQSVKRGQPLFRISSNAYKEQVTRAEASLQRMVAEAKTKSLNVEQIKLMVDKNVISKTELEVATAQLDAARSGEREAASVLENAKINLNYTYIRSPFDGIVDLLPFKRGSLVNSGTLLTSVFNIDNVFAYFKVSEAEYLHLAQDDLKDDRFSEEQQKVSLMLANGSRYSLDGVIETMEGDFDRETGSIAIRARFKNPHKLLKHGSSGKILMTKTMKEAIVVPMESIFSIQDKNYVYVIDDRNIVHARTFTTVARADKNLITNGLHAGEQIVAEGVATLKEGMKVVPLIPQPDSTALSQLEIQ